MAVLSQKSLDSLLEQIPRDSKLRKEAAKNFRAFLAARFTLTKEQERAFARIPQEEFTKLGTHIASITGDDARFGFDLVHFVNQVPPDNVFEVAEIEVRIITFCVTTTIDGRLVSKQCKVVGIEITWGP